MGNRVISRSPSRTGFDLSSLEDEPAEEFVRGEAEAGQGDREAEAGQKRGPKRDTSGGPKRDGSVSQASFLLAHIVNSGPVPLSCLLSRFPVYCQ